LLSWERIANGAKGHNIDSIHIAYIGGDKGAGPNSKQLQTLQYEIQWALEHFPEAKVMGHRDLPNVPKTCPNFNVIEWWYG